MSAGSHAPLAGASRRWILLWLGVLALGLYLRWARLGKPFEPGEGLRSLSAMVAGEAPQPPLYYVLLRLWAGLAGDSLSSQRAFSVLAGLAAVLLAGWLARELFQSRYAAGLTAALVAVSPFHVLLSQQARPEAFFTLALLASCLALVRALGRDGRLDWAAYELTVIAGMYTHLLFGLVLLAQGLWVAEWTRAAPAVLRRLLRLRCLKGALGGVLAFTPWVVVMVYPRWGPAHAPRLGEVSTWLAQLLPLLCLAALVAVAWALARTGDSVDLFRRRVSQALAAVVLLGGLVACIASGRTP